MASSQTGQLDKNFLASTITVPASTTKQSNGGTNVSKKVGNRKQRQWSRPGKGSVTHTVTTTGSTRIRSSSPQTL